MTTSDPGRYRKIYPRLWRSGAFLNLGEGERLLALYVLCGPQINRIGLTHFSIGAAVEDLETLPQTFQERFENVCRVFGWRFDPDARVLWIPNWWRFNPPENENVLKGCLSDLVDIPESPLLAAFANHVETLPETLRQTFRERMAQRLAIQEQEQEQEQEPDLSIEDRESDRSPDLIPTRSRSRSRESEDVPAIVTSSASRRRRASRSDFDAFWQLYPRKVGRDAAWKAWQKRNPDPELIERIRATLAWQRRQEAWIRDGGRYIPHPATWLNRGQWLDEPNTTPRLNERSVALLRGGEEFIKT